MDHLIEVRVKNIPATNYRDYRVKLSLPRFNNKSKTINLNNIVSDEVVRLFFEQNKIKPVAFCSETWINCYLFDFSQVDAILKAFK